MPFGRPTNRTLPHDSASSTFDMCYQWHGGSSRFRGSTSGPWVPSKAMNRFICTSRMLSSHTPSCTVGFTEERTCHSDMTDMNSWCNGKGNNYWCYLDPISPRVLVWSHPSIRYLYEISHCTIIRHNYLTYIFLGFHEHFLNLFYATIHITNTTCLPKNQPWSHRKARKLKGLRRD